MRKSILGIAGGAVLFGASAYAQATTCSAGSLTSFANNTPANATQVNNNFGAVVTCVNNVASGGNLANVTLSGTTLLPGSGAITSTGNIGIGTVSPAGNSANKVLQVSGTGTAGSSGAQLIAVSSDGTQHINLSSGLGGPDVGAAILYKGGPLRFGVETGTDYSGFALKTTFDTSGNGIFIGTLYDSDGAVHTSSDQRLKTNIQNIDRATALSKLSALIPVTYTWRNPGEHRNVQNPGGFVAQQLAKIFPDMVSTTTCQGADCALVGGPHSQMYTIGLGPKFDAYLVAGIQELDARTKTIKDLRAANERQTAEIASLKAKMEVEDRRLSRLEQRLNNRTAAASGSNTDRRMRTAER